MKVTLIDSMGGDLTVVNSARVSFAKVSHEFDERDSKLIRYLADHDHWTPFSQVQYQVRIQAPIFVARQWFKHMVGITRNEVSRRYVDDDPAFFVPPIWRGKPTDGAKQGSSGEIEDKMDADLIMADCYEVADAAYQALLKKGVCPEQARMVLPQATYTEWIETGSLASAARICQQRMDPHAQAEIQELATLFKDAVKYIAPVSFEALMEK